MSSVLVISSFIAGILTILAPCIFPLLPILVGSTLDASGGRKRAYIVIGSLLSSVLFFSILVFGTTNLLGIDVGVLRVLSAIILLIIGSSMLFPELWASLMVKLGVEQSSNKWLASAMKKEGNLRDVAIGAALGPVFSSCSPTYGVILATVLPQNFFEGFLYLIWYLLGLGLSFLLIVLAGQTLTAKLNWAVDPKGWFKRVLGLLFIIIAAAIFFNGDKAFESWLLDRGSYDRLIEFELNRL